MPVIELKKVFSIIITIMLYLQTGMVRDLPGLMCGIYQQICLNGIVVVMITIMTIYVH
nr:MAG TPA: hypothetical protein [Bacteriophage sp.]